MDVAEQRGERRVMRAMARYAASRAAPHDMETIMMLFRFGEFDSIVMDAAAGIISQRADDVFDETWKDDMGVDARVSDWVLALPLELFEHGLVAPVGLLSPEIKARLIRAWGEDVDEDVVADLYRRHAPSHSMLMAFVTCLMRPPERVRTRRRRIRASWTVCPVTGVRGIGFLGGFRVYLTWSLPRFDSSTWRSRLRLPELDPTVARVTWSLGRGCGSVDMGEVLTVTTDAETTLTVTIIDSR
jgi:hypothetical protein